MKSRLSALLINKNELFSGMIDYTELKREHQLFDA